MDRAIQTSRMRPTRSVWVGQIALLAGLYVMFGTFGLEFATHHENASLIWPPTGLALAALILFGQRLWPGVLIGAFLVNLLSTSLTWVASLSIATGNTLEALVGAILLARFSDFQPSLERLHDVAAFLGLGVIVSTTVSPTIGVSTLFLSGAVAANDFALVWLIWWLGDVGGALLLAPALLMLMRGTPPWRNLFGRIEWWLTLALLGATSFLAFSGVVSGLLGFAACISPFPVLVWAGARLGLRGAALTSTTIILTATMATAAGLGPFTMGSDTEAMILLWTYSMLIGITAFTLAAAIEQRNAAELRYRAEEAERLRGEQERLLLLERERLTREMHDGLGGQLVSALAMVERGVGSPEEVAEALRRALDDIRIVIDSLDSKTTDLPTSLGKLRARLGPLLHRNGIAMKWRVDDVSGIHAFSPEKTLHILRIIQEGVTNALRHANADSVEVLVIPSVANANSIHIAIRDTGDGLPNDMSHSGRGIKNMRTRAGSLDATFRIERASPGTRIELEIPIPQPV